MPVQRSVLEKHAHLANDWRKAQKNLWWPQLQKQAEWLQTSQFGHLPKELTHHTGILARKPPVCQHSLKVRNAHGTNCCTHSPSQQKVQVGQNLWWMGTKQHQGEQSVRACLEQSCITQPENDSSGLGSPTWIFAFCLKTQCICQKRAAPKSAKWESNSLKCTQIKNFVQLFAFQFVTEKVVVHPHFSLESFQWQMTFSKQNLNAKNPKTFLSTTINWIRCLSFSWQWTTIFVLQRHFWWVT